MSDRKSNDIMRAVPDSGSMFRGGYRPRGQRGYQPQSSKPLDPMRLTPPTGGSAVQPPSNGAPPTNAAPKER